MFRVQRFSVAVLLLLLVTAMAACQGRPEAVPNTPTPEPTIPPAWHTSEVVMMGTSADYPPANFINDNGDIDGFERELGDELCRRAGLECAWAHDEWFTLINHLLAGEYDAVMAGMAATKERDELIDFSEPYLPNTPSVYVALAGASDDVINGRVAVQVNTVQQQYLTESGVTTIISMPAEDPIEAVRSGQADAVFADKTFLNSFVEESGGELIYVGPEVEFDSDHVGIGVRENDAELQDKLNAAIRAMKEDGSLNDLIGKWYGEDAETF